MRKVCIKAALAVIVGSLLLGGVARAQEPVKSVKVNLGANTVSFDGQFPSDFELGGTARAGVSPHLALVGGAFFGLGHSYTRANLGVRVTATDVDNRDFSVGFGGEYQLSSEPSIRPEEWAGVVAIGYRPWPVDIPRLVVGASGSYGFDSNTAMLVLALRWNLTTF